MIQVVVDDLALIEVDAVVRPADAMLAPVTPAVSRLDELGGERFAAQRRVTTGLEAGAAVVTGGGDLAAPFVLHVVIRDDRSEGGRDVIRRALVSAWQRAQDWGLRTVAAPLVGIGAGHLSLEEAAGLLAETFPRAGSGLNPEELRIVVEREDERETVEAIVRRR
ncbi:MAG TPA: macro domain-containing protein, partial [Gemmatimonadales bacterium]|nr:macro domain-containing protein [Gemmatimonadales bacterium]